MKFKHFGFSIQSVLLLFGILAFFILFNAATIFAQPGKVLTINKVSNSDLLVSRDGNFQGPFNTTYGITTNYTDFNAVGDSIKSAIISDFDRSPTIGYIKAPLTIVGLNATGGNLSSLANPFASIDQINEKIDEQFSWAWSVAAHSQRVNEIKCIFGEALIDFKCEVFPSVERLRSNSMNSSLIYS